VTVVVIVVSGVVVTVLVTFWVMLEAYGVLMLRVVLTVLVLVTKAVVGAVTVLVDAVTPRQLQVLAMAVLATF